MTEDLLFAVLIGAGTLMVLLGAIYFLQRFMLRRSSGESHRPLAAMPPAVSPAAGDEARRREAVNLETEFFRHAFGAARFDLQILGEHQAVVQATVAAIRDAIQQQEYFPRRPLLIPQLMRAMHDDDTSRQKLASIVLQDPVLAGDVLKLANSSYYRTSSAPLENIERAIVVLGTQGLKSVVASSLLQPVFHGRKGHFENFSAIIWNYALLAGNAAARQAGKTGSCDRFSAHLLGLLSALGPLVLFRLTLDKYQLHPGVLPRPEVFAHIIQCHGSLTTRLIAAHWELSQPFIEALAEQDGEPAPATALGRVLQHGRRAAMSAVLAGSV